MADATTVQFVEGDATTVQFVDGDVTTVAIGDATTVVVEMSGIPIPGEEGGGGSPTGGAGGVLSGTYPNPGFAVNMAEQSELDAEATARASADTALDGRLDTVEAALPAKADLAGGLILTSQLPTLAVTDVFTVANQAAMLALTAQRGDLAIRTDTGHRFVLSADTPGTLAAWVDLGAATDAVSSVNGQAGIIVLGASDVGADTAGAAAAAQAHAIQRANHTGTQDPSTITGTAVITTDARLGVRRRVLSASACGAAISGTPLWDIGTTSAAALAAGALLCMRSEIDSQQTVELLVNVTATALSSGQQIHLATYAMGANGLPTGAPVWSTPITVGTSTGVMATASVLLPPAPFFVSFLNPSTNAGTVTLTLAQPVAHVGLNFALTNRPVLVGPSSSTFPTVTGWTISSSAAASVWGTMALAPVVVGRA